MPDSTTNWQVWQDPKVAGRFTDGRRKALLGADAQIDTILRLLAHVPAEQMTVLDLGCGDGILLQAVMGRFAVARGIALDGSPAMLEKAEIRFQDLGLLNALVEFIEADFDDPAWLASLPCQRFDAVVSGFAIHHSEDDRKRGLYGEIYGILNPGGAFINVEHVSSATPLGEELFELAYAESLQRYRRSIGEEVTVEEVLEEQRNRPDKAANRLAPVGIQLQWLREIGFRDVDCYWKQFELAVLAGFKPV